MINIKIKMLTFLFVFLISFAAFGQAVPAPVFIDKTAELGLQKMPNAKTACADFNNDGWMDFYAAGVVWLNDAGKGFKPLKAGKGAAVCADFDNDGFVDIFSYSNLQMYRNIDGKSFKKVALPDFPEKHTSLGACCADLTGNGFLDIYIGGYEDWNAGVTYSDFLLLNEGKSSFRFVENDTACRARGVAACDFNNSGNIDIYISNYRLQPNLLLIGDGSGQFINKAADFNAVATSGRFKGAHTIGSLWADFDNDSYFDLFVANFAHRDSRGDQPQSRFLRNTGAGGNYSFKDLGTRGIRYQESYAHPAAADFDNDGLVDLFLTTVYGTASFGKKNYPVLYRNTSSWRFNDVTDLQGLANLKPTYQAVWADFNNDGYLDLITSGKLFINQGAGSNWLKVSLLGDGENISTSAIGSQVRIELDGSTLTRQVEAGSGEGNQSSPVLHFGLGNRNEPVDLQITWQGEKKQTVEAVEINQTLTITYKHNPER